MLMTHPTYFPYSSWVTNIYSGNEVFGELQFKIYQDLNITVKKENDFP